VPKLLELHALHDLPVADVHAGDDAFGQHRAVLSAGGTCLECVQRVLDTAPVDTMPLYTELKVVSENLEAGVT
jgi:hypothetical protein